jgi:RNA polymerase sigma factor (sigma-70 family)
VTAQAPSQGKPTPATRRLVHRSDDTLRTMAARGNADAFGAIYERHWKALYRYCCSILGHAEDAGDALHNTMAKAWEALRRAEPEAPLRPWLFRIAHNEAVSVLRRRRMDGTLDEASIVATAGVEETLELRERLTTLRADLAALPERQRGALLLRELCGLRHTEIAVVLAVSPATARQTIYEARVALFEAEAGRGTACEAIQKALSDGDGRVRRGRRIGAHLRTCQLCTGFEARLRRHPSELAALVPPLPAAASLGGLARLLPHASTSGAMPSVGAGTATGPLSSAITTMAELTSGVAAKLVVGSVVVAVGGVAGANRPQSAPRPSAPTPVIFVAAHGSPVVGAPMGRVGHATAEPTAHASPPARPIADRAPGPAPAGDPVGGADEPPLPAADPDDGAGTPPAAGERPGAATQAATSSGPSAEPEAVAQRPTTAVGPGAQGTAVVGAPSASSTGPVTTSTDVPQASSAEDSGNEQAPPAATSAASDPGSSSTSVGPPAPASKPGPEPGSPSSEPATPAATPEPALGDEQREHARPVREPSGAANDTPGLGRPPAEDAEVPASPSSHESRPPVDSPGRGPKEVPGQDDPPGELPEHGPKQDASDEPGPPAEPPGHEPKHAASDEPGPPADPPGHGPKHAASDEPGPPAEPPAHGPPDASTAESPRATADESHIAPPREAAADRSADRRRSAEPHDPAAKEPSREESSSPDGHSRPADNAPREAGPANQTRRDAPRSGAGEPRDASQPRSATSERTSAEAAGATPRANAPRQRSDKPPGR